jgi:hypothetical protein
MADLKYDLLTMMIDGSMKAAAEIIKNPSGKMIPIVLSLRKRPDIYKRLADSLKIVLGERYPKYVKEEVPGLIDANMGKDIMTASLNAECILCGIETIKLADKD